MVSDCGSTGDDSPDGFGSGTACSCIAVGKWVSLVAGAENIKTAPPTAANMRTAARPTTGSRERVCGQSTTLKVFRKTWTNGRFGHWAGSCNRGRSDRCDLQNLAVRGLTFRFSRARTTVCSAMIRRASSLALSFSCSPSKLTVEAELVPNSAESTFGTFDSFRDQRFAFLYLNRSGAKDLTKNDSRIKTVGGSQGHCLDHHFRDLRRDGRIDFARRA